MLRGDKDCGYLYKIVLVGEAGVGKTHILSQYIKGNLPKNPTATIGAEFATMTVPLQSGGTVRAQIWDTSGRESYTAYTFAPFRRAVGAMLVYDVTNERSFANAKRWMEGLRDHAEPDIVIMLVGNKIDLYDRNPASRRVSFQQGTAFANANGLLFEETSSITCARVRESFQTLFEAIYKKSLTKVQTKSDTTRLSARLAASKKSSSITDRLKESFGAFLGAIYDKKPSANNREETKCVTNEDVASLKRENEKLNKEKNTRMIEVENLSNGLRQKEEEVKALIDQLRLKEEECKYKDQEIIDLKDKYKKLDEQSKRNNEVILNSPISMNRQRTLNILFPSIPDYSPKQ